MDKILEKVSLLPYSPKITVANRELHIYFAVLKTGLKNGWDDTELQVDLVLSDAASTSEA